MSVCSHGMGSAINPTPSPSRDHSTPPPDQTTPPRTTKAGGTHPTGMLSCCLFFYLFSFSLPFSLGVNRAKGVKFICLPMFCLYQFYCNKAYVSLINFVNMRGLQGDCRIFCCQLMYVHLLSTYLGAST